MLNYLDKIQLDLRDEESVTKERVLFALCIFVCEARKESGEYFPPKTLKDIVYMI